MSNKLRRMGKEIMNPDITCCQADAVRRIRMVPVKGIPTGIAILDEIIAEVQEMNLSSDNQIRETLLKKIKVYNYIPKATEEAYLKAILGVYQKSS